MPFYVIRRLGRIRLTAPPPTPYNLSLILRVGLTARNRASFRRQSGFVRRKLLDAHLLVE
jgi:hypothetical protein